jgi:hypothetical protein
LDQVPRGVEFGNDTFIQHNQSVIIDHSLQTMCN